VNEHNKHEIDTFPVYWRMALTGTVYSKDTVYSGTVHEKCPISLATFWMLQM